MAATASKYLRCEVVSPERVVFTGDVDMVVVTTPQGELGILPLHIPLVSELSIGELRIKQKDKWIRLFVDGGILKISEDRVTVLANFAQFTSEIDLKSAIYERDEAVELMKKKEEGIDFTKLQEDYLRAITKIRIAEKT